MGTLALFFVASVHLAAFYQLEMTYMSLVTSRMGWLTFSSLHRTKTQDAIAIISGGTIFLLEMVKVKDRRLIFFFSLV